MSPCETCRIAGCAGPGPIPLRLRRQWGQLRCAALFLRGSGQGDAPTVRPSAPSPTRVRGSWGGGDGGRSALRANPGRPDLALPEGLTLQGWSLEDGLLTLSLSEQYGGLADVSLTLADYCLVLTLSQVDGVDAVQIQSAGHTYHSRSHQTMQAEGGHFGPGGSVRPRGLRPSLFLDKHARSHYSLILEYYLFRKRESP